MRLKWSARAIDDRNAILDYVSTESPRAAIGLDEHIVARVESLLEWPEKGRIGRAANTRELIVTDTPYIAVYRLAGEMIRVVRIIHTAQRWPRKMPEL